jgi:signal transduction histidine kinase
VLLGLQSNALKFTEKGFVKIEVSIEESTPSKKRKIMFKVIDSGVGIEYKDQDKLFKLFGFL